MCRVAGLRRSFEAMAVWMTSRRRWAPAMSGFTQPGVVQMGYEAPDISPGRRRGSYRAEVVAAGEINHSVLWAGDADVKNLIGYTWIGWVGAAMSRSSLSTVTSSSRMRGSDVDGDVLLNGSIPVSQAARGSVTIGTPFFGGVGRLAKGRHGGLDRRHHQVRAGPQQPHPRRRPGTVGRDGPGPRPDLVRRRPDRTLVGLSTTTLATTASAGYEWLTTEDIDWRRALDVQATL